ncbi:uncharacterized protein DAT39_007124, partial [Clarias magur]
QSLCKNELVSHIDVSTELQSDVLLPCNFNLIPLGSDKSVDMAVVWSERSAAVETVTEITLEGELRLRTNKCGRIKLFPKLWESGNFSIVLQMVQPYDLNLYHCELVNGANCRIAYHQLQLGPSDLVVQSQKSIIPAVLGGVILLCLFKICFCCLGNSCVAGKLKLDPESNFENCYTEVMYTFDTEQPWTKSVQKLIVSHFDVSNELQSDVLLMCNFNPALIKKSCENSQHHRSECAVSALFDN